MQQLLPSPERCEYENVVRPHYAPAAITECGTAIGRGGRPAGRPLDQRFDRADHWGPGGGRQNVAPKVTVSDYAGSSRVTFTWNVSSLPGQVKGYLARCSDDYHNSM